MNLVFANKRQIVLKRVLNADALVVFDLLLNRRPRLARKATPRFDGRDGENTTSVRPGIENTSLWTRITTSFVRNDDDEWLTQFSSTGPSAELQITQASPMTKMFGHDDLQVFTTHTHKSALRFTPTAAAVAAVAAAAAGVANEPFFAVRVRWAFHEQSFELNESEQVPDTTTAPDDARKRAISRVFDDALALVGDIEAQRKQVELLLDESVKRSSDGNNVLESAFVDISAPLPTQLAVGTRLLRRSWRGRGDVEVTVARGAGN
jgi:hypothetical protein